MIYINLININFIFISFRKWNNYFYIINIYLKILMIISEAKIYLLNLMKPVY